MRVIFAIDEATRESHINTMPACMKWALDRAKTTGRPIKILVARPGSKTARIIAEATSEGLRAVNAGSVWKRKKLERSYE
tara:strand:+ start:4337 stop:4576 length:240 start_codon:yes stop_codon:yes gene_type:complete